ncbi:MAG: hypothetical protein ACP5NS_03770 [Candidatus Pacearchaeota archaeon]
MHNKGVLLFSLFLTISLVILLIFNFPLSNASQDRNDQRSVGLKYNLEGNEKYFENLISYIGCPPPGTSPSIAIDNRCTIFAIAILNDMMFPNAQIDVETLIDDLTYCMEKKGYKNIKALGIPAGTRASRALFSCKSKLIKEDYSIFEGWKIYTKADTLAGTSIFSRTGCISHAWVVIKLPGNIHHTYACEIPFWAINTTTDSVSLDCKDYADYQNNDWTNIDVSPTGQVSIDNSASTTEILAVGVPFNNGPL